MNAKILAIHCCLTFFPYVYAGVDGYFQNPKPVIGYAEGATIETTTGYAIFQRGQVMPKYVLKTDATGTMEYMNPGPTPTISGGVWGKALLLDAI